MGLIIMLIIKNLCSPSPQLHFPSARPLIVPESSIWSHCHLSSFHVSAFLVLDEDKVCEPKVPAIFIATGAKICEWERLVYFSSLRDFFLHATAPATVTAKFRRVCPHK